MNCGAWTKAAEAELRQHLADKLSYDKIAARMGVTRSTIAGKIYRLGLNGTARPRRPGLNGAGPRKKASATSISATQDSHRDWYARRSLNPSAIRKKAETPPKPRVVKRPLPAPPVAAEPVNLMDAVSRQCRYPLWGHKAKPSIAEMMFCGGKTDEGSSFCKGCRSRVFQARAA